jgi:alpha-D-ribose 1-methylphosphonate 5-triphosphate synthase subunit PhnH
MVLDKVHDLQSVFRNLLQAFSFPGRIVEISGTISRMDADLPLAPHLVLPALTLLDAETTFSVVSDQSDVHSKLLSRLTYARYLPPQEADFLFVTANQDHILQALQDAREGTLEEPHRGSTIVLETGYLFSDDPENETHQESPAAWTPGDRKWELTGPGIPGRRILQAAGMDGWNHRRTDRNREFPLGVDMVLVTPEGKLAALPRTSRISELC